MSNNNLTSKSVGLLQSLPQTHYAYAGGFLLTGEIIGERKRVLDDLSGCGGSMEQMRHPHFVLEYDTGM